MSRSSEKGLFIVLEGIDGAGKTTIAYKLVEYFRSRGYNTIYTYEPYTSLYVEVLKKNYNEFRDAYLDALTYAADRLIHLKTVIIPHLKKRGVVICDRYFYSSVAYQAAQGAPIDWIIEVNKYMLKPDLAIYLDVDPETGLQRRKRFKSRFPEYESLEFLRRVREVYIELVNKGFLVLVDARRDIDTVYHSVLQIIKDRINWIR